MSCIEVKGFFYKLPWRSGAPHALTAWRESPSAVASETDFQLSSILAPLEPLRDQLVVLSGLDMKSAMGEQSQSGIIAWLTGTRQEQANTFAKGPSLDQVLATEVLGGATPHPSLELAVRWGTGKSVGQVHPINITAYANDSEFTPIQPRIDPQETFDELFGNLEGSTEALWDASILDHVGRRYEDLALRLGGEDRQRLEEHLTRLRELELAVQGVGGCVAPGLVDTTGYEPRAGEQADLGSNGNCETEDCLRSDELIPVVGKLFTDMLVMAMACDLTRVGTLQWADVEAKYTLPWLGLYEGHNYYENDGGFRPDDLEIIYTWYSEQHAYLLEQMAAVDLGGHSLLDESVIFFGTEVSRPDNHSKSDMPFLLAGSGGGLEGGRWLSYDGESHNDLLVSLLNLFGDERTTFGNPEDVTGPLAGIL
jgi:hypothetical protein